LISHRVLMLTPWNGTPSWETNRCSAG